MHHLAAGSLNRLNHAWVVVTDRRAYLPRGEIQHALPINGLHKRTGRAAHHPVDERPPIANQQPYAVIHTDRLQLPHLIADTGADRPPLSGRVLAELHELLDNVGERLCSVNLVGAASPQ